MEAATPRGDPSLLRWEPFDVAPISLCVVWVVKEQSSSILKPPSRSRNGTFKSFQRGNIAFIQLRLVFLWNRAHKTRICDSCTLFAFKCVHLSSYKSAKDNKNTALIAENYIIWALQWALNWRQGGCVLLLLKISVCIAIMRLSQRVHLTFVTNVIWLLLRSKPVKRRRSQI